MGSSCDYMPGLSFPQGPLHLLLLSLGTQRVAPEEEAADCGSFHATAQGGFSNPKIPSAIGHSPGGFAWASEVIPTPIMIPQMRPWGSRKQGWDEHKDLTDQEEHSAGKLVCICFKNPLLEAF